MTRPVQIIGAPTDYGADRRGVDMGPSAIRYAGLASAIEAIADVDRSCVDDGDLSVPRAEQREPNAGPQAGRAKFLREVEDVSRRLSDVVAGAIDEGRLPLALGGDHSIAIGTINGAARDVDLGVLWFDAHGDFNTPETTPSGNVHGMSLSAVLGLGDFAEMDWAVAPGVDASNVALVGLRDVDPGERVLIEDSAVTAFTMSDVDERGIATIVEEALAVATAGVDGLHVSVDLDFLDPNVSPGVGTPVRGGATYREAHTALEAVAEREALDGILRSLEFVEVNPILDTHNETAELACELAASALGERIL